MGGLAAVRSTDVVCTRVTGEWALLMREGQVSGQPKSLATRHLAARDLLFEAWVSSMVKAVHGATKKKGKILDH